MLGRELQKISDVSLRPPPGTQKTTREQFSQLITSIEAARQVAGKISQKTENQVQAATCVPELAPLKFQ